MGMYPLEVHALRDELDVPAVGDQVDLRVKIR